MDSLFTKEAQFRFGNGSCRGHEKIRQAMAQVLFNYSNNAS